MVYRRAITLGVLLLASSVSLAKDFWEEPFENWNREQINRMLSDSPWSQNETFTSAIDTSTGVSGEKELYFRFTIRFFSALPVRQAYVRMAQLMNNYDQMAVEQRQDFDKRFRKALELDVQDRVIVSLDYATNSPNAERELRQSFEQETTDRLRQSVYLISQRLKRVELQAYFPPSGDGTGAKFIFPRTVNGEPVFGPQDKEIRFDFDVPATHQHIFLTFKSAKMAYKGQLSF